MAWLWKSKDKGMKMPDTPVVAQFKPLECSHLWKDFPWYIRASYTRGSTTNKLAITVTEPYVCVKCKKRKDVVLEEDCIERSKLSSEDAAKVLEDYKKKYKGRWAEKAIVEDMISDFQLVDRQALEWLGYIKRFGQENGIVLTLERSNGEKYEIKLEGDSNA